MIADTGAPAQIEALIWQRVEEGCTAVANAPIHPDAHTALTNLAVAATNRPA